MTDEGLEQIRDHVVSTAESLEEYDSDDYDEFMEGILDFRLTVGLDGDVRDVEALWTFGGPNIWLGLSSGRVDGYWDTEEWSTHCDCELFEIAESYAIDMYEANRSHR